jgi:uncharacterized membrane protein YfcA
LDPFWIAGIAAVAAGAVAAVSGFGIGSFMTPVLILWMPTAHAVAVLAIPHAWATTLRWLRLRKDVDRLTFRQFGIASAIGGLAGALLQSRLTSPALTLVLAVLLAISGGAELAARPVPIPKTRAWRLGGGLLSGLFGGLVGNQGGIRAAALLGFRLEPRQLVATATASALLVDAARMPIYFMTSGSVIATNARLGVAVLVGVTVGTVLGVPILGRISTLVYRRVIGGLLLLLAASLVVAATTD